MVYIKLILFICFSTFAFADYDIVNSKNIDGTTYSIISTEAKIMNTNNSAIEKSLVFENIKGDVAVSKNIYKDIPTAHGDKVAIYYMVKSGEEKKQIYEIFFSLDKLKFPDYSLDVANNVSAKELNETRLSYHKSVPNYNIVYYFLFMVFLTLSGFFNYEKLPFKKIHTVVQVIIMLIFFIGVKHIHNMHYQDDIVKTTGTIDYHIDPYIIFKNLDGDASRSQMDMQSIKNKKRYTPITLYYIDSTQEGFVDNRGHRFNYKVYLSYEEASENRETPLHTYVAFFMLFILMYKFYMSKYKLFLPNSIVTRYTLYHYKKEREYFSELKSMIKSQEDDENYISDYILYTNQENQIVVKYQRLWNTLVPLAVGGLLLWALSKLIPAFFIDDISITTEDGSFFYIFTFILFVLAILFITIVKKNIFSSNILATFDYKRKKIYLNSSDETIPFDKIYGYSIEYKRLHISYDVGYVYFYTLDIIFTDGTVQALLSNQNDKEELLEQAKIISQYTNRPIYDFGKSKFLDKEK